MTRTVLGLEFAAIHETKASSTWQLGPITLVRETDPECFRATCQGLNSSWQRSDEIALRELRRVAVESYAAGAEVLALLGGVG